MPNNEGDRYYWSLHSENATGENVGAVLDDLSDIKVTPEEELDDQHKAIIVEYDEDLGRNKFKLDTAGGKAEISADENQILIGDGENWAKGGAFNVEKFDNKSLGESYEHWWALTARTEEYQDNLPQGIIIQGNKTKTFSKNPPSGWGSMSFTSKLPYLALRDDSYCLFDNKAYVKFNDADVQITGKAQLIIDGSSELRLNDGASIRGTTVNNEIQFQFDDGTSSVNFTVAELTALKTLLTQIPIQVVQSASEATEQGIMYFVDGGGN